MLQTFEHTNFKTVTTFRGCVLNVCISVPVLQLRGSSKKGVSPRARLQVPPAVLTRARPSSPTFSGKPASPAAYQEQRGEEPRPVPPTASTSAPAPAAAPGRSGPDLVEHVRGDEGDSHGVGTGQAAVRKKSETGDIRPRLLTGRKPVRSFSVHNFKRILILQHLGDAVGFETHS